MPIVGSPSRAATSATTGTARSAETVSTPSTSCCSPDRLDRVDVGEVHDLGNVGDPEPERVGVPIDGDDAEPALARLDDRPALVAAGADEEDARHGAMLTIGRPAWGSIGTMRHGP